MRTEWMRRLSLIGWLLRKCGPYLALEIVLPGGTLFAVLLFLYQRRQAQTGGAPDLQPLVQLRRLFDAAGGVMRAGLQPSMAGMRELARTRATF
jgi:hypothetical protein